MKKLWMVVGVAILSIYTLLGCNAPTPSATVPTSKPEVTLKDYEQVLAITSALPSSFSKLNSAEEGMSNADLGLGGDFSETVVHLQDTPYEVVVGLYSIWSGRTMQAANDATIRDDGQIRSILDYNAKKYLSQQGLDLTSLDITITHPQIGDLAVLGKGSMYYSGAVCGYDIILFKVGKVYVNLEYIYLENKSTSLPQLAERVVANLSIYNCE